MASRTAGVGWFAVGFVAGVGATLAAIIFATRPQPMQAAVPAPTAPAAAVVTYHAPQFAGVAAQSPPAPILPHPPSAPAAVPPARAAALDRQTQEDAAAAGMTSRSRPGG